METSGCTYLGPFYSSCKLPIVVSRFATLGWVWDIPFAPEEIYPFR
jgi:hypothetical protein